LRRSKNKGKYKSLLERDFAAHLKKQEIPAEYEPDKFSYVRPSHYTPDWKVGEKLYLETKGEFAPSQRANLLAFKAQNPDIEIIMVFANAQNLLHKRAKMTYAQWCDKNEIRYHDLRAEYNKKKKEYVIRNPIKREVFT
jgi:hypothetical protein